MTDPIRKAADAVVDAYDKYGQGLVPSFIAAIIKRELEKAVPALIPSSEYEAGHNECRKAFLGEAE